MAVSGKAIPLQSWFLPQVKRLRGWRLAGYLGMLLAAVVVGVPLAWMLSAAFKETREIYSLSVSWIPSHPILDNFPRAWESAPFARYYLNSTTIVLVGTAGKLITGTLAAYALAFLDFPYKKPVFVMVLAGLMVPQQVTVLPNYILMGGLGWVNSWQAIVLPSIPTAVGTFLLRQAFLSLPSEVVEAARLDGAGHLAIIRHVLLPMVRPVLVTFSLLSMEGIWNDFLWPLVVTNTAEMRTLPIGIFWLLDQEGNTEWGVVMAGTILVILPPLLVFLWAQRHIVEGIAAGAIKG